MKKTHKLLALSVLLLFLWGCTGLTGGYQRRNIATDMPVMTDGQQTLYVYSCLPREGYFREENGTFCLAENPYPDDTLTECAPGLRLVMDAWRIGLMQDLVPAFAPEDAFLEAGFRQLMDEEDYFECRIYEKDGEYFGILNCYRRCAGRSGTILAYEDLKYGRLLTVENGALVFGEKMNDTALLACNSSHYITYRDKTISSMCKATGQQLEITEDLWWEQRPSDTGYVTFCQTEDVFYMTGCHEDVYTVYACYMDGTGLQQLLCEPK